MASDTAAPEPITVNLETLLRRLPTAALSLSAASERVRPEPLVATFQRADSGGETVIS